MATTSAPEPGGRAVRAAAALSEQLYARHHRMVAGLCRALLRDPAEAEDAAQQAFLSAHRALVNGAEPREPAAWLATIARNECWSRIRGRMREPLATDEADTVVGTGDPLAEAIRRADLAALWAAIEALPRTQRDALLLREFGGLRYDELAVALAVTEPAVESLLVRARTRLRAQLKAAYATVSGGAWLEWLARLATGGAAPAAATKAVALGLGAAAVTGGAVVGPRLVDRHQARHTPPARTTTSTHRPLRTTPTAMPAAAPTIAAVMTPPPAVVRRRTARLTPPPPPRHDSEDAGPTATVERSRGEGQDGAQTTEHGDGGGDRSAPVTTTTVERSNGQEDTQTTEHHDGGEDQTVTTTTVAVLEVSGGDGGDGHEDGSSGPGG